MRMTRYSRRVFLLLILVLFCVPLIAHIYLGSYSRFIADDFCSSAMARSQGVFGATVHWYVSWTGRFSANFLDSLFGYLGPSVTPYATGLVITLWFIVLTLAVAQLIATAEERVLQSCVIAAMVLFAVLDVIPFVGQSLYWGQGMRSVVPPLILGTAYVGMIANRSASPAVEKITPVWFGTAALITFIAAGFAETYFAVQTSVLVFTLLIAVVSNRYAPPDKRNYLLLLVAGLIGSLAGGLLMFVAPGNQFRRSAYPPPPAPPELLSIALRGLREFFELVVFSPSHRFTWAGLLLCMFILGIFRHYEAPSDTRRHIWTLVWLPVVGFVLLLVCWIPMAWGTSLLLAYRTLIIPAYVLVCLLACWAYIAGRVCYAFVRRRSVLVTILSLLPLLAFGLFAANTGRKTWMLRSTFAEYAGNWDERERMIETAKSQGMPYAVVRRLHNWAALEEIAVDPKITWLTKCLQDYYGIGVIPDLGDLYGEPNGEVKQAAVERQFDMIPKLPGSVPTELNQIYKSDRGKIGFYKSSATPDQIKSFYKSEFLKLGWKHIGEKKVEAYQRFTGGTQNLFCNGEVAATLFITAQDEQRLGYTYSLALNWGMSSGLTWGVVDCQGP